VDEGGRGGVHDGEETLPIVQDPEQSPQEGPYIRRRPGQAAQPLGHGRVRGEAPLARNCGDGQAAIAPDFDGPSWQPRVQADDAEAILDPEGPIPGEGDSDGPRGRRQVRCGL